MKNKILPASCAVLSLIALLTGCGPDESSSSSSTNDTTSASVSVSQSATETTELTEPESEAILTSDIQEAAQPEITTIKSSSNSSSATVTKAPVANVTQNVPTAAPVLTQKPAETTAAAEIKTEGSLLPPVSSDLQQLYQEAYEVYKAYSMGRSSLFDGTTVTINDYPYCRVKDSYFTNMQGVSDYYHKYFTDNFISQLGIMSEFVEQDGYVYATDGSKGGIVGYAGHTYEITNQTDNEIDIKATCYIAMSDEDTSQLFFSVPDDMSKYETMERSIVFKKENGNWRMDKLEIMW